MYEESEYQYTRPQAQQKSMGRLLPLILMCLLGFLIARWIPAFRPLNNPNAQPRPIQARGDLAETEKTTVELFRTRAPSVAFIATAKVESNLFFSRKTSSGAGSGFVWDKEGHIVTNDHVIAGANEATVILSDKSSWPASVVGRAPGKDLAVLRINAPARNLQPIDLGTSKDLLVGQNVFAIGNPFGLDYTLTTGVISALDRHIEADGIVTKRKINGVIQTDAAINPGNSGGPLLDSSGLLIGVNTAIYSPSGAYAGVGFAIPVDTVNRIVPQLIRHRKIVRPTIGVIPFGDRVFREKNQGVVIQSIERDSPADRAGLQPTLVMRSRRSWQAGVYQLGDIIVKADDKEISNLDDWLSFLESRKPGDVVRLTVIRNALNSRRATQLSVDVRLEEDTNF